MERQATTGSTDRNGRSGYLLEVEGVGKYFEVGAAQPLLAGNYLRRLFRAETRQPFWGLKNISFQLRRGEALGIIGQNGAGKSTLLRILAGVTRPSAGRVLIRGRVASILDVGSGFHPELSGRENVVFQGRLMGYNRVEVAERLDEILEFSEIGAFFDQPVKHYSSGMFLRLAFSSAVFFGAELMLLDEVLAVGDAAFQQRCLDKMNEMRQQGHSFLIVSHNLPEIAQFCDRLMLLAKGELQVLAESREALTAYQQLLVSGGEEGAGRSRLFGEWVAVERLWAEREDVSSVEGPFAPNLHIRGEFYFRQALPPVHLGVSLSDAKQTILFGDGSLFESGSLCREAGVRQRFSWKIPESILLSGIYYLNLHLLDDSRGIIGRQRQALEIQIQHEDPPEAKLLGRFFSIRLPGLFSVEPITQNPLPTP